MTIFCEPSIGWSGLLCQLLRCSYMNAAVQGEGGEGGSCSRLCWRYADTCSTQDDMCLRYAGRLMHCLPFCMEQSMNGSADLKGKQGLLFMGTDQAPGMGLSQCQGPGPQLGRWPIGQNLERKVEVYATGEKLPTTKRATATHRFIYIYTYI